VSQQPIRILNLGCGDVYLRDCLNVDSTDRTVCDLLARGEALPLTEGCLEEVRALHVLEHAGYLGTVAILGECRRLLRQGGTLILETPRVEEAWRGFQEQVGDHHDPQGLSLVFGRPDDPGLAHRALLPEGLLRELLAQAGFVEVTEQPPRTHLDRPGLRLVATRGDDPRHLLLARLRAQEGLLFADTPHLDQEARHELEARVHGKVLSLPGLAPDAAEEVILDLILVHPGLARYLLSQLQALGLGLARDVTSLLRLAERAATAHFERLLWDALRRLAATTTLVPDPLVALEAEARLVLAEARPPPPLDLGGALQARVARLGDGHLLRSSLAGYTLPETGPFLRSRVQAATRQVLAVALRHLERDDLAAGRRGLHLATNLRQDAIYPLWNLAVLQARLGHLERAVSFYRTARLQGPPPTVRTVLEQEESLCLAALGRDAEARWLQDHAAAVARRTAHAGEDLFAAGPAEPEALTPAAGEEQGFAPPRTRPVLAQEAWQRLP